MSMVRRSLVALIDISDTYRAYINTFAICSQPFRGSFAAKKALVDDGPDWGARNRESSRKATLSPGLTTGSAGHPKAT